MVLLHLREDLFYRLRGLVLRTPALDERTEDIAMLARLFLGRATNGEATFGPDTLTWLTARRWPGNVREQLAAVECAAALAPEAATGISVSASNLAFATGEATTSMPAAGHQTLEEEVAALELRRISEALHRTGRNHTNAARELGLSRVGLLKKIDRMGLR